MIALLAGLALAGTKPAPPCPTPIKVTLRISPKHATYEQARIAVTVRNISRRKLLLLSGLGLLVQDIQMKGIPIEVSPVKFAENLGGFSPMQPVEPGHAVHATLLWSDFLRNYGPGENDFHGPARGIDVRARLIYSENSDDRRFYPLGMLVREDVPSNWVFLHLSRNKVEARPKKRKEGASDDLPAVWNKPTSPYKLTRSMIAHMPNDEVVDRLSRAAIGYVEGACDRNSALTELSSGMRMLYGTSILDADVAQRYGFLQYFWNTSGSTADTALHGLELIGDKERAAVLRTAIQYWHQDEPALQKYLEIGTADAWTKAQYMTKLQELNENYGKVEPKLATLQLAYLRAHPEAFIQPASHNSPEQTMKPGANPNRPYSK